MGTVQRVKSLGLILNTLGATLRRQRSNTRVVLWLLGLLVALVALYSTLFHLIMEHEGRNYSWATSVYWSLTTMSTLGFGDITFHSDLGRIFSIVVLISGALFILVLLPFAVIQFLFLPWMAARDRARAPRRLPDHVRDHIVLTRLDAVSRSLIHRADATAVPYVVIVDDLTEALVMADQGLNVLVGDLDDPATWTAARVETAALVATTQPDTTNTNITFTVREINVAVPIIATASKHSSVEVLQLAGCDHVLHMGSLLGSAMARRVLGTDHCAHAIGEFGDLLIAEADPRHTPIVGRSLTELDLRNRYEVSLAGIWRRGTFTMPAPDSVVTSDDILVLAGSRRQLNAYDAAFGTMDGRTRTEADGHALVIGGGRVGRSCARNLTDNRTAVTVIEQDTSRTRPDWTYVVGDATEIDVLEAAGIDRSSAVLVTTHDDDINVYLTILCRRLRPDVQIISRANLDRNVATLHRAGADSVLSYASIGATAIWNVLGDDDSIVLADTLEVFRTPLPASMAGRSLRQLDLRRSTGCNVVAVIEQGHTITNPDAEDPLPQQAELVLIGEASSRDRFFREHPIAPRR